MRPWALSYQRAIAEARDDVAKALRPVMRDHPTPLKIRAVAALLGLDCNTYHLKRLLDRGARPVEIVNAIVAYHFHISTNDVQLARRDAKTRFDALDEFTSY